MTNLTHNPDGSFTISEVKKERYRVLVISVISWINNEISSGFMFYENEIVADAVDNNNTRHTFYQRNYFKKI